MSKLTAAASASYTLPTISDGLNGCTDDTWTATSTINAPCPSDHTAVWTGSEMIVWGGYDASTFLNTGGRYNPSTDSWTATSTTNAPDARDDHTAVWTGSEMIVWGGYHGSQRFQHRREIQSQHGQLDSHQHHQRARRPTAHTAVWTGSEMIVWGGANVSSDLNTGGRYNPTTDSWTATSTTNAPDARSITRQSGPAAK